MALRVGVEQICLIGPRGAGKTTCGRRLAARLSWPRVDTDETVEHAAGMSVSEFFVRHGEQAFRDAEQAAFEALHGRRPCVITTGGGIILRPINRVNLRSVDVVAYLTAEPAALCRRVNADVTHSGRLPLTALSPYEEMVAILKQREPLYREVAHVVIDTTGQTPDDVVDAVLAAC